MFQLLRADFAVDNGRAIREMLAFGLNDPYSRFITPEEFQAMRKYDVTGVGLNLATAEEFVRKSGLSLPPHSADAQVCVPLPPMCTVCKQR